MPVPSMNSQSLCQMRQRCRKPNGYYCNGFRARGKPPQSIAWGRTMYVLIKHTDIIVVTFTKTTNTATNKQRKKEKNYTSNNKFKNDWQVVKEFMACSPCIATIIPVNVRLFISTIAARSDSFLVFKHSHCCKVCQCVTYPKKRNSAVISTLRLSST